MNDVVIALIAIMKVAFSSNFSRSRKWLITMYSIHKICIYVTDFFNILLESDKRSIEDKEVTWGDKASIIF